jgi:hypothetical protein
MDGATENEKKKNPPYSIGRKEQAAGEGRR